VYQFSGGRSQLVRVLGLEAGLDIDNLVTPGSAADLERIVDGTIFANSLIQKEEVGVGSGGRTQLLTEFQQHTTQRTACKSLIVRRAHCERHVTARNGNRTFIARSPARSFWSELLLQKVQPRLVENIDTLSCGNRLATRQFAFVLEALASRVLLKIC
jgi:hypothetical protein